MTSTICIQCGEAMQQPSRSNPNACGACELIAAELGRLDSQGAHQCRFCGRPLASKYLPGQPEGGWCNNRCYRNYLEGLGNDNY